MTQSQPADSDDTATIREFLRRHGVSAPPQPMAGDASARRYLRLPGTGLLLMEDSSAPQDFRAYLQISAYLNQLGLSAPRVTAADPVHCLALIEDWGEATYTRRLAAGGSECDLYALAVDTLARLHNDPRAAALPLPRFDLAVMLEELDIFCAWFAPALAPALDVERFSNRFRQLWQRALAGVAARQDTLVLRDFHIDNLMELAGRAGVRACGLLDFQDGAIGAREYDLVSLLQDARRDLAPGLEAAMLQRYLAAVSPGDEGQEGTLARYHLLGAQRHARIAGVFVRLWRRDGKPGYLRWLPRVLRQLDAALQAAKLDAIRTLLDAELPGWRQRGSALGTTYSGPAAAGSSMAAGPSGRLA